MMPPTVRLRSAAGVRVADFVFMGPLRPPLARVLFAIRLASPRLGRSMGRSSLLPKHVHWPRLENAGPPRPRRAAASRLQGRRGARCRRRGPQRLASREADCAG